MTRRRRYAATGTAVQSALTDRPGARNSRTRYSREDALSYFRRARDPQRIAIVTRWNAFLNKYIYFDSQRNKHRKWWYIPTYCHCKCHARISNLTLCKIMVLYLPESRLWFDSPVELTDRSSSMHSSSSSSSPSSSSLFVLPVPVNDTQCQSTIIVSIYYRI